MTQLVLHRTPTPALDRTHASIFCVVAEPNSSYIRHCDSLHTRIAVDKLHVTVERTAMIPAMMFLSPRVSSYDTAAAGASGITVTRTLSQWLTVPA